MRRWFSRFSILRRTAARVLRRIRHLPIRRLRRARRRGRASKRGHWRFFDGGLMQIQQPAPAVFVGRDTNYFCVRIHFTIVAMSASFTCALGGIIISPQTPLPPSLTFFTSVASAALSPRYFAATSLYDGPRTFLS